jgi:uridine phosphorylase
MGKLTPKLEPSIITPRTYRSYKASTLKVTPRELDIPARLLFTYHTNMFRTARQHIRGRYLRWYYGWRLVVGKLRGVELAVLQPFMGSAMAGTMLEEMIAFGAKQIVEVGMCGGLASGMQVGGIIVAENAFVDEGMSRHYFVAPSKFSASDKISKAIKDSLKDAHLDFTVGGIWTTDAPYRETRTKLARFQKLGAVGVDMETSAMFAIARYRRVDIGSIQVISDLVRKRDWKPAFHEKLVAERSEAVTRSALNALVRV